MMLPDLKVRIIKLLWKEQKWNKVTQNQMIRGLEHLCWESWGCSAWGGEGCGETLEQLPVPGGAARELERGWDKGMG